MGRRSSKERVTLQYFEKEEQRLTALTPEIGSVIRIGKPSNRYYQYIFSSLDFLQQKISDLAELLDIEGIEVEITGFDGTTPVIPILVGSPVSASNPMSVNSRSRFSPDASGEESPELDSG